MPQRLYPKRKHILVLIFAVAAIFITFQFFSYEALGYFTRRGFHAQFGDHGEVDIKIVRGNRHIGRNDALEFDLNIADEREARRKNDDDREKIIIKPKDFKLPRGVHKNDWKNYIPDKNNMFECKNKKQRIPFSWVNDDSCDCGDSSDEPGTSACPKSWFFCGTQIPDKLPQSIPASLVNDGLCDCCDGSDEWQALSPNKDVDRAAHDTETVLVVPCKNLCDKVIQRKEEDARIRSLGKRQQAKYLEAANKLSDREKQDYGPRGIFYKLSENCFSFKSSGYDYKVCPFKSVTQQQFPRASVLIGEVPSWQYQSEGLYVLSMKKGDSHLCPDGFSRMSVITFLCGITDRVVQVAEDERCVYNVKFATPAAC